MAVRIHSSTYPLGKEESVLPPNMLSSPATMAPSKQSGQIAPTCCDWEKASSLTDARGQDHVRPTHNLREGISSQPLRVDFLGEDQ